jgi:hypothetical protein
MPASAYLEKAMLDWVCGGATPTQPAGFWGALAVGTPTSISASEMAAATGYTRQTALFAPASTLSSASCSNSAAMTFGPFSSSGSALGVTIWDASPIGSTNLLWYQTFLSARTFLSGDYLFIGAGALTLTLV